MYQPKPSEARREHRHERIEVAAGKHPSAHRNGAARPGACLRLVRVPGGFAYVADEPAGRSMAT